MRLTLKVDSAPSLPDATEKKVEPKTPFRTEGKIRNFVKLVGGAYVSNQMKKNGQAAAESNERTRNEWISKMAEEIAPPLHEAFEQVSSWKSVWDSWLAQMKSCSLKRHGHGAIKSKE